MIDLTPEAHENYVGCVVMSVLATLILALRIYSRLDSGQRLLLCDYLCILSYAIFIGYCALLWNYIFHVSEVGAFEGQFTPTDHPKVSPKETGDFMKMGYIAMILFTTMVSVVKVSILSFYWTIFSIDALQRRIIIGTLALSIAWFIGFIFAIIFQCKPISALWEKWFEVGHCLSTPKLLLAVEVSNLLIDVVILSVPAFFVNRLQLDTRKKWAVLGMFLMGAAVCVVSIVRVTHIWRPPNVAANFDTSKTILWSTIQMGMAIICACLPTLGHLIKSSKLSSKARTWYGSLRDRQGSSGYQISSNRSNTGRPWEGDGNDRFHAAAGKAWDKLPNDGSESDHIPLDPLPPKQIRVQKDIQVS
ncbi:unnamed protein product [Clonostachys rosea f. rosea IK726]|uniref:Rhodopsin domain-containing protein n=2 Tax=Bionectria ochroleuca TaxID=29856 RepID=A0A0B7JVX5_BIOOC|nr:unnamed protein product [Clonostachys rosea f. rosea IK726]